MTGLVWMSNANFAEAPVTWEAALEAVARLSVETNLHWRLPNINELESLVHCSMHSPALTAEHPFSGVEDTYWSSTTSLYEPDWAWARYFNKGAVGVGHKSAARFHVWPVVETVGM